MIFACVAPALRLPFFFRKRSLAFLSALLILGSLRFFLGFGTVGFPVDPSILATSSAIDSTISGAAADTAGFNAGGSGE